METIYNSKYFEILHDEVNSIFESHWRDTSHITPDIFKQEMFEYVALSKKHLPKNYLTDSTFTITIELQEWVAVHVFPHTMHPSVEKFALILPKDFFAQISLEQTIDIGENIIGSVPTRYFDLYEEALAWILKK